MDANYQRRAEKRPLDLIQDTDHEDLVEIQPNKKPTGLLFYLDHNWQLVYNSDSTSSDPSASNPRETHIVNRPIDTPVQHVSQPMPALNRPIDEPVQHVSQPMPALNRLIDAPVQHVPQPMPALNRPIDAPVQHVPQPMPALNRPIDAPVQHVSQPMPALNRPIDAPVQHVSQPMPALNRRHWVHVWKPQYSSPLVYFKPVRQQLQQLLPLRLEQYSTSVNHVPQNWAPSFPLRPLNHPIHPPQAYPLRSQELYNKLPDFFRIGATPSPNHRRINPAPKQPSSFSISRPPRHEPQHSPAQAGAPLVPLDRRAGHPRVPISENQAPQQLVRLSISRPPHHEPQHSPAQAGAPLVPLDRRAGHPRVPISENQAPQQLVRLSISRPPRHEPQHSPAQVGAPLVLLDRRAGTPRMPISENQAPSQQLEMHRQNVPEGSAQLMPRSNDPGWKYARVVNHHNRSWVKCNLCGKECDRKSGITRMKKHIAGISREITACLVATEEIRHEMRDNIYRFQRRGGATARRGA